MECKLSYGATCHEQATSIARQRCDESAMLVEKVAATKAIHDKLAIDDDGLKVQYDELLADSREVQNILAKVRGRGFLGQLFPP